MQRTVFQLPGPMGKGVLVTPTVHGNLLVGPTAADQPQRDRTATTAEGLAYAQDMARKSVPGLPLRDVITSFAGLRAHLAERGGRLPHRPARPRVFRGSGHRVPGAVLGPGHRGLSGGAGGGVSGGGGKAGLRPPAPGHRPPAGAALCPAAASGGGKPRLRQYRVPVRGHQRGRDRGRYPPHPRGPVPGRGEAPGAGRYGPVPGGFCTPGSWRSCPGSWECPRRS